MVPAQQGGGDRRFESRWRDVTRAQGSLRGTWRTTSGFRYPQKSGTDRQRSSSPGSRFQLVFVELVSQLLQGSCPSGADRAGRDSGGMGDLGVGAGIVSEQFP